MKLRNVKVAKRLGTKNACRVACIWTCRRYAVGCSGRCTEHDVTVRGFVEQKYLDFSDETKSRLKRMVRINIRQQKKR